MAESLHDQTIRKAFEKGKRDALAQRAFDSQSKPGSAWDKHYEYGYEKGEQELREANNG